MTKRNSSLGLLFGFVVVLLFVGLSHLRPAPFEDLERFILDKEMGLSAKEEPVNPRVALIHIDERSLSHFGAWPWPRRLLAEMIDVLREGGAKVVGLNLPLSQKAPNPALKALESFRRRLNTYPLADKDNALTTWMEQSLEQTREEFDDDRKLVESVRRSGNVVLAVFAQLGKSSPETENQADPLLSRNSLTPVDDPLARTGSPLASRLTLPFPELAQNALGLGHGTLIRENGTALPSHPLFVRHKGLLVPSYPLRLAIAYYDLQPPQVVVDEDHVRLKGQRIAVHQGEVPVLFQGENRPILQYAFLDVLRGKEALSRLKGKVVLIGLRARHNPLVMTSTDSKMSEDELAAHILEAVLDNTVLSRPPFMPIIEILGICLLGALAVVLLPRLGGLGGLALGGGLTVLVLLAGMFLFSRMGIWLKTSYLGSCLITLCLLASLKPFFSMRGGTLQTYEANRLLGLGFQSQGLLDLAFDKFRRLPVDLETKELIYNLGLEYERKRNVEKALIAYEYIAKWGSYRDLTERISRLKTSDSASAPVSYAEGGDGSTPADPTADIPTKVGRYEIIEELGKGSMGQVYKGLDPKINRLLAIKTIRFLDEFEEDLIQEIKERFFREAEIAGRLSHPSIVTIHDVGEDRDLTYMAMEFLEGENLEKFIAKDNLLPFRKALDVIAEVAEALDYAHQEGVIHRDIKPANIMLLKNGGIKVTDFGIAKAVSSSRTKTGVILGTPNYMSPEQIMGQKMDLRSDIFSLGVLFFQLLTGELPFQGENLSGLLYQITQVAHPSVRNYRPKLPRVCDQILDKALAKDPGDRFRSAREMGQIIRLVGSKVDQLKENRGPGVRPSNGA